MVLALLSSSDLQTRAVGIVTSEVSRSLGSAVQVGRVSYRMPATIRLEDIYVEDKQQDTLIYIHEVYARLNPKALLHNEVRFHKALVDGAYVNIHDHNADFIAPLFVSSDTLTTAMHTLITAPKIQITSSRIHVDDHHVDVDLFDLHLHELSQDTFTLSVDELQAQYVYVPNLQRGAKPIQIRDFDTRIQMCNRYTTLPYFDLKLPHSVVQIKNLTINFPKDLYDARGNRAYDYAAAAPYIDMNMELDRLDIYPPDLAMIEPMLGRLQRHATLSCALNGTLDSLYMKDLNLKYNRQSILKADLFVKGLPDYQNAYVKASCRDLYVNAGIAQDIISDIEQSPFRLPASIQNLGQVHYRGQIIGNVRDLTLRGGFRTAQGTISTDGEMHLDNVFKTLSFRGGIATTSFHLGQVLENKNVGDLSMHVFTDLFMTNREVNADIEAAIDSFYCLGNTYRGLTFNGRTERGNIEGTIAIHNPHLSFTGYINHQKDSVQTRTSSLLIDSLALSNGEDSMLMKELDFTHVAQRNGEKTVKLTSDYLAGALIGQLDYKTLPTTFKKLIITYLPSLFSREQRREIAAQLSDNNFRFYLYGRELKHLQRVLKLPYRISDYPVMKGYVTEADNHWVIQGYVPYLVNERNRLEDITFSSDNLANRANVAFSAKAGYTQLTLHSFAQDDSCRLAINIDNIDPARKDSNFVQTYSQSKKLTEQIDFIEGDLDFTAHFAQYAGKPLLDLHIYPSYLQYGDSIYHLSESNLTYSSADTLLTIDHFRIGTQSQFIEASGIGSPSPEDMLSVKLSELNAAYLLRFALPEKELTVQGDITGWANVYGLFSNPAFEADVRIDSACLNNAYVGDATGKLTLDKDNYNILIDADVVESGHRVAHVDGLVEPIDERWGLDIYADSISVAFINHWTSDFINDISGRVYGKVSVFGGTKNQKTWVTTAAYADSVGVTIPYTGCRYYATDSIFMDSTSIRFPNLVLHDKEGNELYFDGVITHNDRFEDFKFDLVARPNHTLVFDLPYQPREMLSGHTYASGEVRVFGDEQEVSLTANARAMDKSTFRFNIGFASSAANSDFITFYDHHIVETTEEDEIETALKEVAGPSTRFKMALNVEVDPTLDFRLVLNAGTGDEIRARGDGAFTVGYDDKTEAISMVGTYTLSQGTMSYTVANIIRRDFTIADGSSIVWSGEAENPTLNVTADYTCSASLKDLFGTDVSSITTSRTNIPVTTSITLTGTLDDPVIRFALSLPRSEREIEDKVRAVINTEEMLMRQVIYLLVFGRFFTPEYMATSNSLISTNAVYSLVSSTLTNQINQWLGRLTNVFSMGVNVRKEGQGAQSSYEAEAKFQLQPVDRLLINGDVGYRYNDITNRPFFGDMDIEYMLTENGKVRVKAYTHTVDKYSLRQASTIQGVGFVFKHDFNWPKPKKKK